MKNLLQVKNLSIEFKRRDSRIFAVRDVSFEVFSNETIAIVGESGCGKSALAKSILGLLPENAKISSGSIFYDDRNLLNLKESYLRTIRGNEIGLVFQDPFLSLNPTMKIGHQVCEALFAHKMCSVKDAKSVFYKILNEVKIKNPEAVFEMYPHQLSGGMKQRILIAIAVVCKPKLLIADEPTTALDVTVQTQILKLLKDLQRCYNMSMLLITHDMTVVADICDKMIVMYAGEIVEIGKTKEIISSPKHPYTRMLLDSVPTLDKHKIFNRLKPIDGFLPVIDSPISYCSFVQRCPNAMQICAKKRPDLIKNKQCTRCWLYDRQKDTKQPDGSQVSQEVVQAGK